MYWQGPPDLRRWEPPVQGKLRKSTLTVAAITAAVTILGWNVSHFLSRRRDDRTRRIESSIRQLDRQFEEFYGPLHSLIDEISNVWRVRQRVFEELSADQENEVRIFVWQEYFLLLHEEIRELLKTRSYLAVG